MSDLEKRKNDMMEQIRDVNSKSKFDDTLNKAKEKGPPISNTFYLKRYSTMLTERGLNTTMFNTVKNSTFLTSDKGLKMARTSSMKFSSASLKVPPFEKKSSNLSIHENLPNNQDSAVQVDKEENDEKFLWETQMKKKLNNLLSRRSQSMADLHSSNPSSLNNTQYSRKHQLPWAYFNKKAGRPSTDMNDQKDGASNFESTSMRKRFANAFQNVPASKNQYNVDSEVKKCIKGYQMFSSFLGTQERFFKKFKQIHDLNEVVVDSYFFPDLENEFLKSKQKEKTVESNHSSIVNIPPISHKAKMSYVFENIKTTMKKKKRKHNSSKSDFPLELF